MVNGVPTDQNSRDLKTILDSYMEASVNTSLSAANDRKEKLAYAMAKSNAIDYGKHLEEREMSQLFDQLFTCTNQNFTTTGKQIITIIPLEDIERQMK